MSRQIFHIAPRDGSHDMEEDSPDCWCEPVKKQKCEECKNSGNPKCPICNGEGMEVGDDEERLVVVIHADRERKKE